MRRCLEMESVGIAALASVVQFLLVRLPMNALAWSAGAKHRWQRNSSRQGDDQ